MSVISWFLVSAVNGVGFHRYVPFMQFDSAVCGHCPLSCIVVTKRPNLVTW